MITKEQFTRKNNSSYGKVDEEKDQKKVPTAAAPQLGGSAEKVLSPQASADSTPGQQQNSPLAPQLPNVFLQKQESACLLVPLKSKDRERSKNRSRNRRRGRGNDDRSDAGERSMDRTEEDQRSCEETRNEQPEDFVELEKKLRELEFYHGFLPREDLSTILSNRGDYLLRVSEVHEEKRVRREIILSLIPVGNEKSAETTKAPPPKNVIIKRSGKVFYIEPAKTFEDVKELLNHYKKNTGTCNNLVFQLKNPMLLQPWEFMHCDVLIGKVLGEGAFGKVTSGVLKTKNGEMVEVAVKMTKGTAFLSKAKIREMMNEARFIRNFNHKNVVRLYGVAHDEQPLYILLELVKGGSLKSYLAKNKTTLSEKMKHCLGSARGIEYLHQNKCIHRDIAARNCLLSDGIIKITDFGLSRTGPSYKLRTSCKLPIRWLPPEVLTTLTFSYGSDVYSHAVMIYEIFSDGGEPFENQSNAIVKSDILAGKFLQMPAACPEPLKVLISTKVFVENPKRASMTEIANEIEKLATQIEEGHGKLNLKKNFRSLKKKVF